VQVNRITLDSSAMANTCEIRVGRLMEIKVDQGFRCAEDVRWMIASMAKAATRLDAGVKYLIAADWRGVTIMSPEVAAEARAMLARNNPRVERSAILTLPEQSTTSLQVQRLVREAENAQRRHFIDIREQCGWLAQVLSEAETTRLHEFMGTAADAH
jgi:hypothetical protein